MYKLVVLLESLYNSYLVGILNKNSLKDTKLICNIVEIDNILSYNLIDTVISSIIDINEKRFYYE